MLTPLSYPPQRQQRPSGVPGALRSPRRQQASSSVEDILLTLAMSAFGGKADILFCTANVSFWPKADIRSCTAHVCFWGGKADMESSTALPANPGTALPTGHSKILTSFFGQSAAVTRAEGGDRQHREASRSDIHDCIVGRAAHRCHSQSAYCFEGAEAALWTARNHNSRRA